MALFLPVGYSSVRFVFRCTGIVDSMGFTIAFAPGTGFDAASVAQDVNVATSTSAWWTSAAASTQYSFESIEATFMDSTGPITAIAAVNDVGTTVVATPPSNWCVLVRKTTAFGGRTNRGRIYQPPAQVGEGNVDATGTMLTAQVTALQTRWDDFFTDLAAASLNPVLLHTDPAETPTPILAFTVQALGATQRRRMR